MVIGGIVELAIGIKAEGKSLEDITKPITATEQAPVAVPSPRSPTDEEERWTRYDVIIIGSGAGGGTLARHLAPSGKRILILERGDWLPREKQNWDRTEVFVDNRYVSKDTWYDAERQAVPAGCPLLRRRRDEDVRRRDVSACASRTSASSSHCRRHRRRTGRSAYDELEPYYTQAEKLYHVHGAARRRPHRSTGQRALSVSRREPRAARSGDRRRLERAGYRPSYAPTGIMLDEADRPHSRCIRCKSCDGYPCLVHAKADAEVIAVRPALQHPNVTLETKRPGSSGSKPTPADARSPR